MKSLAWAVLIMSGALTITAPFRIGQKSEYDKVSAALSFGDFLLYLLLCGEILGWWR